MTSTRFDSATPGTPAPGPGERASRLGYVARPFGAVHGLAWSLCSSAALAMMSERDLDDLGLLPTEVRSEFPSLAIEA